MKPRTSEQIEAMRRSGRVVGQILERLRELARPGTATGELDRQAERMIRESGAAGLFKNQPNPRRGGRPFPGFICTSVNEEVVHGIPGRRVLQEGDVLSIDCGVRLGGWCGDAAVTVPVGTISPGSARLIDVTAGTLDLAIKLIRPGVRWSEIAAQMQRFVEQAGMSVVTEYVGHGIGTQMWEPPKVPNFWARGWSGEDFVLVEGMTLAIEPMVNLGGSGVTAGSDDWTIVTVDRQPSAHFEHTVAVTAGGADVLTAAR